MLDRDSFIPLYYQLAQQLRGAIESGELPAGSLLPSERELMQQHRLSRNTVRQALDLLAKDGLLIRSHGSGTRVASLSHAYQYILNTFFENRDLLLQAGYQPTVDIVSTEQTLPPEVARQALQLAKGISVINKKLIFYANGKPAMYTLDYLPMAAAEEYDLTPEGLGFMKYLDRASGRRVEFVTVDLSPVEASGEIAATFDLPVGSPLLLMKETFLDETQKIPIAFSMNYFNRELMSFRLLTRRG